ncbi:hypothetical protein TNCV_461051 [Trichonephila clavipes]|nr:hypothetical protein TNCV_461051 [Trichonephila clavipes]
MESRPTRIAIPQITILWQWNPDTYCPYGEWKLRRKLLTPSFHSDMLRDYLSVFNEQSQKLMRSFESETKKEFTFIEESIYMCTLYTICGKGLKNLGFNGRAATHKQNISPQNVNCRLLAVKLTVIGLWTCGKMFFGVTDLALQSCSPMGASGNEKVSNHGSIPITIDCNVVAFIVFEEGFHQPIKRTKQNHPWSSIRRYGRRRLKLYDIFQKIMDQKKLQYLNGNKEESKGKKKALIDVLLQQHFENQVLKDENIREDIDVLIIGDLLDPRAMFAVLRAGSCRKIRLRQRP